MARASAGAARRTASAARAAAAAGCRHRSTRGRHPVQVCIPSGLDYNPPRRVGRTIARPRPRVVASRKVRAPQRRVAGNARPPRGEDQCHRDVARTRAQLERGVKRGKLCSEQGQIGGRGSSARATGRSGGRGRAAQSSGRPLEPSGNRRPEMDDRRRGFGPGTELGLQAGSPPSCRRGPGPSRGCGLPVRSGADVSRRTQSPEGGFARPPRKRRPDRSSSSGRKM